MILSANNQKILKIIHLLFASIWFSSILTMTTITILADGLTDGGEFYMLINIYHFIDFIILTPAAVGVLVTGFVYSIFTRWGFFKHGWLIYKWITTIILVAAGTFYLGPMTTEMLNISEELRITALGNEEFLSRWQIGFWAGVINTAMLLIAFILSTLKPWKNIKKA